MKDKVWIIFLVLTLGFMAYTLIYFDHSGYYRVAVEKGANVYRSVFVSADSIDVLPFDTVVKIEGFEGLSAAEMLVDGQTVYVKKSDLEVVKRTYDIWGVLQYLFYFIILCIALNMGYKYMRKHHVKQLARLKTGIYVVVTIAIIGVMIKTLTEPSDPPRLTPEAKNRITVEMNIDGFRPSTEREVEVLCHYDDYDFLVRDDCTNQFVVPVNGLATKVKRLDHLNEDFTYNVSKKKLDGYMGKEIWQMAEEVGDYVTGLGLVYDFPYLVAIENGERVQGVKVVTNQMGVIQDIQYNEKERSSNIFSKLPFYETIACKNMYVSISITGDNSIWERLTVVGINFFLLGFVILMIARTASVISHWMGEKSFSVRTSVKVLIWVVCAPFIYIYSVALLDFYHSWWIIVLVYIFTIISMTFEMGTENAAKSIYKCPSCQKNGVYAPTEKVIRRVHTKTVYDWSRGKTERGIRIPEKICTLDVTYIMEGRCNECGYVDTNTYKREQTVTGTTECPLCHTTLKITEEDGVHFEKCPKCDFTAVIVKTRPASAPTENPFAPIKDEPKSSNEESEHEQKERERREEEDRNFLNHQLQENKRKAQEEHDKHLEEAEKAKFYNGKAEDADDPDEASEAAERARRHSEAAEKSYKEHEDAVSEADSCGRQML